MDAGSQCSSSCAVHVLSVACSLWYRDFTVEALVALVRMFNGYLSQPKGAADLLGYFSSNIGLYVLSCCAALCLMGCMHLGSFLNTLLCSAMKRFRSCERMMGFHLRYHLHSLAFSVYLLLLLFPSTLISLTPSLLSSHSLSFSLSSLSPSFSSSYLSFLSFASILLNVLLSSLFLSMLLLNSFPCLHPPSPSLSSLSLFAEIAERRKGVQQGAC